MDFLQCHRPHWLQIHGSNKVQCFIVLSKEFIIINTFHISSLWLLKGIVFAWGLVCSVSAERDWVGVVQGSWVREVFCNRCFVLDWLGLFTQRKYCAQPRATQGLLQYDVCTDRRLESVESKGQENSLVNKDNYRPPLITQATVAAGSLISLRRWVERKLWNLSIQSNLPLCVKGFEMWDAADVKGEQIF